MNILSSIQLGTSSKFLIKIENGSTASVFELDTTPSNGINAITPSSLSNEQYDALDPVVYASPSDVDVPILSAIESLRDAFDAIYTNLPK